MALRISGASVRTPLPAFVLFAVLVVLGIAGFRALPITRAPNVDIPVVAVTVTQPGAAPPELEAQITKRIEDAVAGVPGVKHIRSSVTDGSSTSWIEFRLEVGIDRAVNDVRDAVARVRADLPSAIDEPIIERVDVVGQSILTFAASAQSLTLEQLSWFVDDTVTRALQDVPGVGKVERIGGMTREIRVSLNPDRLFSLGITAGEVNAQLRATNLDLAGGRGEVAGQEESIRTLASAPDLASLASASIVLSGGRQVRLDDLGHVTDGGEEPRTFARLDGERPVVAFAIYRAKGASDVTVSRLVAQRLAAVSAAHPDVSYTVIDDGVRASRGTFDAAIRTLAEGAAFTILVVFLFLRDVRATFIAAVALPLSIIPAFGAMWLMGFSFNFVSLLAVTLVSGVLVDDAIVEIENIVRHMRTTGVHAYRAAIEAADEIGPAVVAITLTISAVFVPVSFMGGIAGQYFKQFGLTVAAAAIASLLVARLITPVMAAYLLRPVRRTRRLRPLTMRLYLGVLKASLQHRLLAVLAGFLMFAVSIWSLSLLPIGFIPADDSARAVLSLELPPGSTLDATAAKTDAVAHAFRAVPEVVSVFTVGGRTPSGADPEVRRASMVVTLAPKDRRSRTQKAVESDLSRLLAAIPDTRGWFINDRDDRELSVAVLGDDPLALDRGAARLESAMRRTPKLMNVVASGGAQRREIHIVPRRDQAARLGVSAATISEAARIATLGDAEANLARFHSGDRLVPVRVEADRTLRGDMNLIGALPVATATGTEIALSAVADIFMSQGPTSVERYDRVRQIVIGADLTEGLALGQALDDINALPEARELPPGVRLQRVGDAEIMDEVFASLGNAVKLGLLIVLGLLVLLFGSVLQPFTILLSVPLSLGGVTLALVLTGEPISLPVAIGVLMLMGIVTKNAIMIVDAAHEERARGAARLDAILAAAHKRARPIVMTSIAMIAGMIPSAFGTGDGGEFRAPMATSLIGGLIVSTLLSLVFVPSLYTVIDDCSRLLARVLGRLLLSRNTRTRSELTGELDRHIAD
ncbi:MAG: efflux RND transporter permease subunit [Acetobacteraceae bacterium]|nr:efflux RND transporter permease subunit [Acetobacteraceae bacterium]